MPVSSHRRINPEIVIAMDGQRSAHRLGERGVAGIGPPEPIRSPRLSRSEPYRAIIERGLALGRNAHGDLLGPWSAITVVAGCCRVPEIRSLSP